MTPLLHYYLARGSQLCKNVYSWKRKPIMQYWFQTLASSNHPFYQANYLRYIHEVSFIWNLRQCQFHVSTVFNLILFFISCHFIFLYFGLKGTPCLLLMWCWRVKIKITVCNFITHLPPVTIDQTFSTVLIQTHVRQNDYLSFMLVVQYSLSAWFCGSKLPNE